MYQTAGLNTLFNPKLLLKDEMKRDEKMKDKPYGLSTHEISLQRDGFNSRYGGGSMVKCIQGLYEKDFLLESKLNHFRK